MKRPAWMAALCLAACGGFRNAPIEPVDVPMADVHDQGEPDDVSAVDVPPCLQPIPLELRIDYLPGVRVGEAVADGVAAIST